MDHGAAQATLVEISFGVNTLGAVYEKLLKIISEQVAQSLDRTLGQVEALGGDKKNQPTPPDQQKLNIITKKLKAIADWHETLQEDSIPWMTFVSSVFAIICILVIYGGSVDASHIQFAFQWQWLNWIRSEIYFDWVEYLGPWALVLMLPLPAYVTLSYTNYFIFAVRAKLRARHYAGYLSDEQEYNPSSELPDPILLKDHKKFPVTVLLAVAFNFTNPDRCVPIGTEVAVLGLHDGIYAVDFEGQEYPIRQADLESSPVK